MHDTDNRLTTDAVLTKVACNVTCYSDKLKQFN